MFEQVRKRDCGVFSYAAHEESLFEKVIEPTGYVRKTTFYSDLSIAEWYGRDAVDDTYSRVMREWITDIEFICEFIMCLDCKCWESFYHGDGDAQAFYGDLFTAAYDAFSKFYKNDEVALDYLAHIVNYMDGYRYEH